MPEKYQANISKRSGMASEHNKKINNKGDDIMTPVKDKKTGKWLIQFYYKNAFGENKKTTKRGFSSKKEAEEWYMNFKLSQNGNLNMTLEAFVQIYISDLKNKIRENTWISKMQIIETKILPYFKNKRMCDIEPKDIIKWQNELEALTNKQGKHYAPTYLRTINSQLSAIFNHACRYYKLHENPVSKVPAIGKKKAKEMDFWTKEEYLKFADAMMDKPLSYYAFELLYWCGIRLGEMLALTPGDFNFDNNTVSISKSYQRIHGKDVITEPKTEQSIRMVKMPDFLSSEMQDCIKSIYGIKENMRIFNITKSYLHHEMERGCKQTGIKKIRIHDLRHSHISLLINLGFSASAIGKRVGHTSTEITDTYIHLFPSVQTDMADKLNSERNV